MFSSLCFGSILRPYLCFLQPVHRSFWYVFADTPKSWNICNASMTSPRIFSDSVLDIHASQQEFSDYNISQVQQSSMLISIARRSHFIALKLLSRPNFLPNRTCISKSNFLTTINIKYGGPWPDILGCVGGGCGGSRAGRVHHQQHAEAQSRGYLRAVQVLDYS